MKAKFRHRLEYGALRLLVGLLALLPLDVSRRLGAALGLLGYWPFGIRRRVVERQIAAAFPELSADDVKRLARDAYAHLGRTTLESALLLRAGPQRLLSVFEPDQDFRLVDGAIASGRGVTLVSGHVGNWELAGGILAAHGIPIDVIVRRQANPLFDAYLNRTRSKIGMVTVYDQDAVRRVPRAFREGRAVGFVADQGVLGLASTFVPFFGRPAKTPRGAAVFALRYETPVIFVAAMLQPSGKYRFYLEEVPVPRTGDREADVEETVARYTRTLERFVREYPAQYFWHHRRWRRQPPDTPPELRDPSA